MEDATRVVQDAQDAQDAQDLAMHQCRRYLRVVVEIDEHGQLFHCNFQIAVIETVRVVPAQTSVFPSFLDIGVKETQRKTKFSKHQTLLATAIKFIVGDGIVGERSDHVGTQS